MMSSNNNWRLKGTTTNMEEQASDISRELSVHELFYETMCGRFNTSYYFQYALLSSSHSIAKDDIEESLKILINFQPFLRTKVISRVDEDKPPTKKNLGSEHHERLFFAPCNVNISDVLKFRERISSDDLHDMVGEEEQFWSSEERNKEGPRWRLVFNMPNASEDRDTLGKYNYEMLFTMNHQFSDAVSGYDIVYRQFLPILNKVINNFPVDEVFLKPLELTPSFEEDILGIRNSADLHPVWYVKSGLKLLRAKNRLMQGEHFGYPAIFSEGAPFEENAKGVGIFKCSFKETLVKKILHERKQKEVTVHSILLTGFSFGMIRLLQDRGMRLPKEIKSGWPIDSRKKLEKYHSPQPLGMFIGTSGMTSMKVPKPYRLDKDVFWKRAKKIGTQVQKNTQNQHEKLIFNGIAYIVEHTQCETVNQFLGELGLNQHFDLSNLGKCAVGSDLEVGFPKVVDAEEIYFGLLGSGFSELSLSFFNTVVNHKGKLFFMLLYSKRWMKEDLPEKLFSFTEEILGEMCDNPEV